MRELLQRFHLNGHSTGFYAQQIPKEAQIWKHKFGEDRKGLQLSFLKLLSLTVWFLKFIFVARNV